jgi:hypothetical protein
MMEIELKKLADTIKSIHEEMYYLREREEEMQNMNKQTNSRMGWLNFLSLGICLSVAGLQLWQPFSCERTCCSSPMMTNHSKIRVCFFCELLTHVLSIYSNLQ